MQHILILTPEGETITAQDIQQTLEKQGCPVAAIVPWGQQDIQTELICQFQPDALLTFVNDAYCRFFGRARQELMGRSFASVVHQNDQKARKAHIAALSPQEPVKTIEHEHTLPNGESRWLQWTDRAIFEAGRPIQFQSVGRDITEQVRATQALDQRNAALALLNRANQALSASLDQDQVLATFLQEVCHLLGVGALSIWLIDPATDELVCKQAVGPRHEVVSGWRLAMGEGIAGRVAASGESLFVADTRADRRHFKGVDQQTGLEIRSVLSVPLRVKHETIGALQIVDETPNRFDTTDLLLLESLSATASIAIEHARLYEQARQDAETKTRLLREVNHRVKNNLSAIIGILYTERQHAQIKDQSLYQSIMQDLVNRVQGLATVHSLLSASHWAPLRLSNLAEKICRSSLQALPSGKSIFVDVSPSPVQVTSDQAHYLALVINELATNAIKHTAHGRDTTQITICVTLDKDMILFEFKDDGPGYPPDVLSMDQHNVGFDLVKSIVFDGLRGELTLRNKGGAVALIRFKSQVPLQE